MNEVRRGTIISFDATTWLAKVLLDGADVEAIIPAGQWVPQDIVTVDAVVAVLVFGETNTNDAVVLGPYGAVPNWALPLTAPTLKALNLGTATGAAAGQLKLSDKIYPGGTGEWIKAYDLGSIANNGIAALMPDNLQANGVVLVTNLSSSYLAMIVLRGGFNLTVIVFDASAQFSITAGTAGKTNVYWSVANSRYELENKTGGSAFYDLFYFGS